ncbi:hypothetical protein F2Q68_00041152 [Brassica cretica]|uniref:Uncharacterized protein n=1 Tax=Brassica cretica TaxID=69181 RepID=A0A8S9ML75_BRACR|nr:hypothetical protein F2Q68_00041152 [Brassica cretica]
MSCVNQYFSIVFINGIAETELQKKEFQETSLQVDDAFNNNHSNTDTDNAGDKKLREAWRHSKHIGINR